MSEARKRPPGFEDRWTAALAEVDWPRDFRSDRDVAESVGCCLATVLRFRRARGIPAHGARAVAAAQGLGR